MMLSIVFSYRTVEVAIIYRVIDLFLRDLENPEHRTESTFSVRQYRMLRHCYEAG
jgi:hypothetical protein